jgi:hypothetical protein
MTKAIWLAGAALCLFSGQVMAQSTPDAPSAQQGVLVFEPAFFADFQPDTALDMVNRLPGFNFDEGDSGTRGLAGTAGNVLIDGKRPSTKSDSLDEILERISATGVARIELIRGSQPGIDMQGQSVVANVILIRTVTTERVLEGDLYLLPDGRGSPGLSARYSRREGDDQIEGAIAGYWDRTEGDGEGYRRRFSPAGTLIQDADLVLSDQSRNLQATGAVQRRVGGGLLRVNGLLNWSSEDSVQDLLIRSGTGVNSFNEEEQEEVEGELGLNWTRDLGARSSLELTGLQRYSSEDYTGVSASSGGSSTFAADTTTGESVGRAIFRFRPSDGWAVEAGGEVAYNFLDTASAYAENGIPIPLPSSTVKVEELRSELFGQMTWRPGPTLTVEGGLRIEISQISQSGDSDLSKSFVYPKPRLQATWTPWSGHQFRFRAEREVGQLDFGDFTASADIDLGEVEGGNPDLEPQKSNLVEAVYERRFWGEGAFEVMLRHTRVEDAVDVIPLTGGFDGVGNSGDGTDNTLGLSLTLPTEAFGIAGGSLRMSGNWSSSKVLDPVTGEERSFQGDQDFGCDVSFDQNLRGGRWAWGFEHDCNTYRGQTFRVREVRTAHFEPEVWAYVQWKPQRNLTVRTELGNATDRARGNDREIYSGPRDTAPLALRETRRVTSGPWVTLQVRQTF